MLNLFDNTFWNFTWENYVCKNFYGFKTFMMEFLLYQPALILQYKLHVDFARLFNLFSDSKHSLIVC